MDKNKDLDLLELQNLVQKYKCNKSKIWKFKKVHVPLHHKPWIWLNIFPQSRFNQKKGLERMIQP